MLYCTWLILRVISKWIVKLDGIRVSLWCNWTSFGRSSPRHAAIVAWARINGNVTMLFASELALLLAESFEVPLPHMGWEYNDRQPLISACGASSLEVCLAAQPVRHAKRRVARPKCFFNYKMEIWRSNASWFPINNFVDSVGQKSVCGICWILALQI